jgi:hypothetical protein
MIEFLMQTAPPCIDIEQNRCCMSDGASRWEPEEFRRQLIWMAEFLRRWPRHVTAALSTNER